MQICTDTTETQELFVPQGLYLKPMAKLTICVQLPQMKLPGKSISNWEVMEKMKAGIKPDTFSWLKVSKSTLEFIRFEGESENRTQMKNIISRLDNRTMKLSGFPDSLRVRAAEAKTTFPSRHDWDSYFRDAKHMNEMKPGERPDTIHLQMLPCRWFANKKDGDQDKPNEYMLKKVFESFGLVRCVDVPMLDPYRRETNRSSGTIQTFSFGQDLTFEAFVQFDEYIGFVKAMNAFRGMKLMHKGDDGNCFATNIKVDFDRTKHLCDKNIRKRRSEREKLMELEKEKEDRVRKEREMEGKKKEDERKRQQEEEREREIKREEKLEKRKQKHLEKKILAEQKNLAAKQSLEERTLLEASRKAAASRLLTVLFNKAKVVKQKEEIHRRMATLERERLDKIEEEKRCREEEEKRKAKEREKSLVEALTRVKEDERQREKLRRQEVALREKILQNIQSRQEEEQRERLRTELTAGRSKLKSVLVTARTTTTTNDVQIVQNVEASREPQVPKLKSVLVMNQ